MWKAGYLGVPKVVLYPRFVVLECSAGAIVDSDLTQMTNPAGSRPSARNSTKRLVQTMAAVLLGGILLSLFMGEYSYMFIVLSICACGLAFAKYLYE